MPSVSKIFWFYFFSNLKFVGFFCFGIFVLSLHRKRNWDCKFYFPFSWSSHPFARLEPMPVSDQEHSLKVFFSPPASSNKLFSASWAVTAMLPAGLCQPAQQERGGERLWMAQRPLGSWIWDKVLQVGAPSALNWGGLSWPVVEKDTLIHCRNAQMKSAWCMGWTGSTAVRIVSLRVELGDTRNAEGPFSYKPKYIWFFYI